MEVGAAGEQSGAGGLAAAAGGAGRPRRTRDQGRKEPVPECPLRSGRRRPDASFTCLAFAGQTHGSGKETGGGR